jgi:predicted nucleotidyltransferase
MINTLPSDVLAWLQREVGHNVLLSYRGSVAHGLFVPSTEEKSTDDVDLMGFAVGSIENYFGLTEWSRKGTKEVWIGQYDCVFYEIRKAVSLLLAGNPNILSVLWLRPSEYLFLSPAMKELITNRHIFAGKHVFHSFSGYASAQLKKMTSRDPASIREYLGVTYALKQRGAHPTDQTLPELSYPGDYIDCSAWSTEKLLARYRHFIKSGENIGYLGDKRKKLVLEHGYDSKNCAHCIRLLRMAKEFLATGEMQVYRISDVRELLDIKNGKWSLGDVKALAKDLFAETRIEYNRSPLPETADRKGAEDLLIQIVKEPLLL